MAIILASASPQRRAILQQLGIAFAVVPTDVDEVASGDPTTIARVNAERKAAAAVPHAGQGDLVVACDTVVDVDGVPFGKPQTRAEATAMLDVLTGRAHTVVSAVTLMVGDDAPITFDASTRVSFRSPPRALVERYLGSEEWRGRAGGYAIQGLGAAFVSRIEGCYLNVVGFPAAAFLDVVDRDPRIAVAAGLDR